ncbi:sigma-70 family RNA polymerase sigma factor [Bradyrhizobium sp. NP1]|uniref:sigma-70 family RNA polymerase sigma factor n=1 Tax=Bradyrhizobium sp. NP1 TaxID=3049772 RepID=UPI0025A52C2F|nr:sigma-70 family RNA polymerase sigma factor [Bradyrhizobium sp. NP1]WJR81268.1 sigma-70 family RNA polymerase sigma factor [Bradyrhizobium sp. NP1]
MPEGNPPSAPHLFVIRPNQPARQGTASDWSGRMALAQAGNRQEYRALLLEIEPYIRSIARRCFKHEADVEDAVQDVLLTIHAIRHTYDPGRPFAPWLTAIANRRLIDRLRRQTRKAAREIELTAEHETFSQAPANRDEMAERALLDAIERLPPDQRDAVRMLKLNEMSLKDASKSSGRSVSALKVATHRAVANLRRLLKGGHVP